VGIETRNVVEDHRGWRRYSFENNFRQRAEFQIPMSAGDLFELLQPLDVFKPLTQVTSAGRLHLGRHCSRHGNSLRLTAKIIRTGSMCSDERFLPVRWLVRICLERGSKR